MSNEAVVVFAFQVVITKFALILSKTLLVVTKTLALRTTLSLFLLLCDATRKLPKEHLDSYQLVIKIK